MDNHVHQLGMGLLWAWMGICLMAAAPVLESTIIHSPSGHYYLKMVPAQNSGYTAPFDGIGTMYRVTPKQDQSLWSVNWYASSNSLFLSNDGKHLARIGWGGYQQLSEQHPALLFYENGKLFRKYSTAELITDDSNMEFPGKIPYRFIQQIKKFDGSHLTIETVDGVTHTFNINTGIKTNP